MASEEPQRGPARGDRRPQVSERTEGRAQPSAQQHVQQQQPVQRDPLAPAAVAAGMHGLEPDLPSMAVTAFYPPHNAEQMETLETGFAPFWNSLENRPLSEFGSNLP